MIPLDIFADPVCPWCLIGKARLDRALEARPGHPFVLAWHPFQLNPTLPPEGMDRQAFLQARFGAEADRIHAPVIEAARDAGLTLDLAAIRRMPNTLDAHRLIHWAGLEGRQTPVVSALLRAYWREGRDIGDHEVLADIGASQGMDRALVARLLASDADRDTVAEREAHARARGLKAVPTFIIGNQYVVEGAQSTDLWLQVIDDLAQAQAQAQTPPPTTH
ncbi:DsbA family oxidoreductase [Paenirhodobacter populi]|uniref:DsbA family oxidoreductase n=1 Tax=Paenirhodobacter populi TaxID=2306993 RepID=UPI000FE3E0DA|nr:DsbA family oxidoreductase [Sinirhodobacter populi]RWR04495.1 DsbA family oxidoreductase [Sinirhodobacter populi]